MNSTDSQEAKVKENNTCYLVGCPEKPEYEFKITLHFLRGIIVRLCKTHALQAFQAKDETKIFGAKIKLEEKR